MIGASPLHLSNEFGTYNSYGPLSRPKLMRKGQFFSMTLSSNYALKGRWNAQILSEMTRKSSMPSKSSVFRCRSLFLPGAENGIPVGQKAIATLKRMSCALASSRVVFQLAPAIGFIAFVAWGFQPLVHFTRNLLLGKNDDSKKKSGTHDIATVYVQPFLLWTGLMLICRALDPIILPSEVNQAVKQRLLHFVRSLSTVLSFAYCLSSLIQQVQKFFVETGDTNDARTMGFEFAGKTVYTAVWVACISLFMELLGFSTQKWLTAGGLGTVLLTLAGREIFTNFLSSVMINATRPFVVSNWIQTKIEGYEVSGTVEHVGWWSPTIIRGDDREAIHIPNHKFTVNVVRNLSQKTHWRIKTHLAISHLDVNKISNIVADMRKVLAKSPHIEQQRLHRRVFLDNINPENQALMILISCFVKTSHFEEYLGVKEAVLLDLLRVIRHHRARLATPLRTMQKINPEPDAESIPFSDTGFSRARPATYRPFLLTADSYRISGDDKPKTAGRFMRPNEEMHGKDDPTTSSDLNVDANAGSAANATMNRDGDKVEVATNRLDGSREGLSVTGNSDAEIKLISEQNPDKATNEPLGDSNKKSETPLSNSLSLSNQDGKTPMETPTKTVLEKNIVLGVALEGSKRTLPIDEPAARGHDKRGNEESKASTFDSH